MPRRIQQRGYVYCVAVLALVPQGLPTAVVPEEYQLPVLQTADGGE
jgi:hypothetical protein